MRLKKCQNCKHAMKEDDTTILFVNGDKSYFCCDIFGIIEDGAECFEVKRKKITEQFYTKTMMEAN